MDFRQLLSGTAAVLAAAVLTACGAGKGNPGDTYPNAPTTSTAVSGPNSFLLFPNPQVQSGGSLQTDTTAYAQAYYAAVDPTNAEDTLAKWKVVNGFGTSPGPLGEMTVVVGDTHDLGYGRRMTARQNTDGTIAVMVDNYVVSSATSSYGTYTHLNVEAAAAQDKRWFIGTTAIEYRPAPGVAPGTNCRACFAKFSFFDPAGNRALAVNLDGRGAKAMPGICVNCHGGRDDPLTPATGSPTGLPLFPLLQNTASLARGDLAAHYHELKVDSFDYSTASGYTRADEEANLKTINKIVLCSYPLAAASAYPEDACRPAALANEWQGGNDIYIKNAYGGNGMPNATYSDTYVPPAWLSAGQSTLYQGVLVGYCRTCHILRGTGMQPDVDLSNYTTFATYADRIDNHVFDRGNMPLAKFVYDRFWATTSPDTLAAWLEGLGAGYTLHDGSGALLKPGRPYADPGPDRVVAGPITLSAASSQFATTYSWSFVSVPAGGGGAALSSSTSATPLFTPTVNGTYVLQLVVGNGTSFSTPKQLSIVVNNALTPLPSAIRFADIKTVLQTAGCTNVGCHNSPSLATGANPPIVYNSIDRNGDSLIDATDDLWLYTEVRGRINFTDIIASKLLRKPSGNHHNGGLVAGFDTSKPPGDPARANYDLFLNWILNGAPQ